MRALITEHKGFVGRHVFPKLIEAGYEVHGTENLEHFLHSSLASSSWDVVIHLAANIVNVHDRGQIGMCAFDDLALDMKVFNWVERNPPRRALVVMSSCALDFPEDPYCIVKRTVEAFAACLHQHRMPVVILRPFRLADTVAISLQSIRSARFSNAPCATKTRWWCGVAVRCAIGSTLKTSPAQSCMQLGTFPWAFLSPSVPGSARISLLSQNELHKP